MTTWTIVVAAGAGTRFGGPKQYEPLGAGRVLDLALDAARAASDGVVLVVAAGADQAEPGADQAEPGADQAEPGADQAEPGADHVVVGGQSRSDSVRAGLAAVPADADVVIVHDGARPLATPDLFAAVVTAVRAGRAVAAVPVVPVVDTLRAVDGTGVVDRDRVVAVQTPQAFAADALRAAHRDAPEASDDAALVEADGGKVMHVDGEPDNLKITTRADLVIAAALLAARTDPSR